MESNIKEEVDKIRQCYSFLDDEKAEAVAIKTLINKHTEIYKRMLYKDPHKPLSIKTEIVKGCIVSIIS